MDDLGISLGYSPPAPASDGADPYAGMTDSQVVTANTSGTNPDTGALQLNITKMNPNTAAALAQHFRDAAKKGTVDSDAPQDLGSMLGYEKPAPITKDSTNDQILSRLGYSDSDITTLKDDPAYKAFVRLDGDNFMAKDVSEPGSLVDSMRKIPSIGAFLHGADQGVFGTAQLLTHAAHSIGATPDSTPAVFDALAKFNELEYQQGSGVKPDEYVVPKVLGGMAPALLSGGVGLAKALAGRGAATGIAAAAGGAPASALVSGVQLAKNIGQTAASGAGGAMALTPMTNGPSEVSQGARDSFWQQKGEDAKSGALWALGMHGLMKSMFAAGMHVKNKTEVAAKIKSILGAARQAAPQGSAAYQSTLDQLTPLFHNPDYAERELNFAGHGVTPSLGDVTQSGFISKTERAAKSMPFGIGKFRTGTQQPQLATAGEKITNEAFDRMINTKWGGRAEIEKAAKGTGRYAEDAKRVLELMDNAGTDSSKILQAEGKGENIRKLLIKEKLYQARDALAGRAAVDPKLPLEAANKILKGATNASVPNRGFMTDVGNYAKALSDPVMPRNYASFQNDMHNVEGLIQKYGPDSYEGVQLRDLKQAFERTLTNFTDNVNKFAKAERFNITTRDIKPAFVTSAGGGGGGGYTFKALRPVGAAEADPGVRMYADKGAAQFAGSKAPMEPRDVRLRSPVIVEGPEGLAQFKEKLGLPDSATDEEVTNAAVAYAKGSNHDGVVFTKNGVPRQVIDMTKWKRSIGDASQRAGKYYKDTYLPAHEAGVVKAMRTSTPDEIFNQFIQKGRENRAQNFFNSLDAKGQASIQYELIKRAVGNGTDSEGQINPGKVADYLFRNKEASGVFFKGEQKWALDGFLKLMAHSKEASPSGHGGGHGAMSGFFAADALLDVVRGIAEGNAHRAVKGAIASAAGLAGAGKAVAAVTTNEKLRHYMLAASDAAPGSPTMEKLYDKFSQALTLAIGGGVGKTSGETQ